MDVSGHFHGHATVYMWKEHSLFIEWVLGGPHDQSGCFGESKIFSFSQKLNRNG
jgi:hypothetical protein